MENKVAVIFGGTSGIGKSITEGFIKAGATVVPVSRDKNKVLQVYEEMNLDKDLIITADVIKRDEVQKSLDLVVQKYGKVDILVNSSGTHLKKNSLEITDEEWDFVIDTNLKGTFITNQIFGKQMIEQGYGSIINIASLGAHVALTEALPYCASKAGVLILTKTLAVEWAQKNVRVNSISPGVFETPLNAKALAIPERAKKILSNTPMGRYGNTDELVGAALYLSSDMAGFVTGSDVVVDGGFLALGI